MLLAFSETKFEPLTRVQSRGGLRTRLTADSRRLWFILEALGSMPDTALAAAGAALADGVMRIWPSSIIVRHNLDPRH